MPVVVVVYLILLLTTTILCFSRWQILGHADRILAYFVCAAFLYEGASFTFLYTFGKNAFLSHFYSPLEFLLISIYFNRSLKVFRGRLGIIIGLLGVVGSMFNTIFWQPLSGLNSHFLLFESTAVIIYGLIAFHQILTAEEISPYRFAQFWVAICFVLFWGATFMGWGMSSYIQAHKGSLLVLHSYMLQTAVYSLYIGLAVVFLRYKSLIPSGQHA